MFTFSRLLPVFAVCLSGCVYTQNGPLDYADDSVQSQNYLPIGIPYILGGYGTGIPITESLSITAAHVAKWDYSTVVATHEHCDIALIERDNTGKTFPELGLLHREDRVYTTGYGLTGRLLKSEGEYHHDVSFDDSECVYSLTDASIKTGMSGGGVYHLSTGELVGVVSAVGRNAPRMNETGELYRLERYSYFVATHQVSDWLEQEISRYKDRQARED